MINWLRKLIYNRKDKTAPLVACPNPKIPGRYDFSKAIAGKRRGEAREAKRLRIREAVAAIKQAETRESLKIRHGQFGRKEQAQ